MTSTPDPLCAYPLVPRHPSGHPLPTREHHTAVQQQVEALLRGLVPRDQAGGPAQLGAGAAKEELSVEIQVASQGRRAQAGHQGRRQSTGHRWIWGPGGCLQQLCQLFSNATQVWQNFEQALDGLVQGLGPGDKHCLAQHTGDSVQGIWHLGGLSSLRLVDWNEVLLVHRMKLLSVEQCGNSYKYRLHLWHPFR